MDFEYFRKLFVGDVLIVDDEIEDTTSDIFKIKEYLTSQKLCVICEQPFPRTSELGFKKISMVICDWMCIKADDESNARAVITFLNSLLDKVGFLPIFICTSVDKSEIEKYLIDEKKGCRYYKSNNASCVQIVKKEDILGDKLNTHLQNWLMNNPSIKLLKEWESTIEEAKNEMFKMFYMESEYWPYIIAKNFERDGEIPEQAIGEFITKNLLSRLSNYEISPISCNDDIPEVDIENVLKGERCYYYKNTDISAETKFVTGDILKNKESGIFSIVIKRQCDLNRTDNKTLFLLEMKELDVVSNAPIELSDDKKELRVFEEALSLDNKTAKHINKKIDKAYEKTKAFYRGKILETSFEVIIPCVGEMLAVSVDLRKLSVINIEDIAGNYVRAMRLLDPYISIVIEKFASYTSSKGSMRTPDELFSHKYIIDDKDD